MIRKQKSISCRCAGRLAAVVPMSPVHPLGIVMQLVDTKGGVQYFTFEHHRKYQEVQLKFLENVETMDPNSVVVCCKIGLPVLSSPVFLEPLSLAGEVG